jgi:hypothetical protein
MGAMEQRSAKLGAGLSGPDVSSRLDQAPGLSDTAWVLLSRRCSSPSLVVIDPALRGSHQTVGVRGRWR